MFVYFLRGMLPRSHADPRLVLAQKTFTRGLPDINATHGTHVGEYNVNVEKASEQMSVFNEHRSLFSLDSRTVKCKPHFMTGYKSLMPDRKNVRAEMLFRDSIIAWATIPVRGVSLNSPGATTVATTRVAAGVV